jgi:hypothetical protein
VRSRSRVFAAAGSIHFDDERNRRAVEAAGGAVVDPSSGQFGCGARPRGGATLVAELANAAGGFDRGERGGTMTGGSAGVELEARIAARRSGCEPLLLDWATLEVAARRRTACADRALVAVSGRRALLAVAGAPGGGDEAAQLAMLVVETLREHAGENVEPLFAHCRERFEPHAITLAMAAIDADDDTLSWLAVGGPSAVVLRGGGGVERAPQRRNDRPVVLALESGDLLILATDGVRSGFVPDLDPTQPPSRIAEHLVARHGADGADVAVAVARYLGLDEDRLGLMPPALVGEPIERIELRQVRSAGPR